MSTAMPNGAHPTPPVESGPQTAIPHTEIPHMGTSQANVPTPNVTTQVEQPQAPAPPPAPAPNAAPQMPPLPAGITQEAVNAAIEHVQKTGTTDGIAPDVLAAACAQLEAQAAAQGIDLNQALANQQGAGQAPTNHAEAAMMDKQNVRQQFGDQRDAMKEAVADQRTALQNTYTDVIAKSGQGGGGHMDPEQIAALAKAVKELDPQTVALINAVGVMSTNPSILNSVVWIEIIRLMRRLISKEAQKEAQKQIEVALHPTG